MANTDPDNPGKPGFSFVGVLNGLRAAFMGGSQRILPGGGRAIDTGATPKSLLAARKRADYRGPGYRSRMEEAKAKNSVWQNDLEQLVLDRLRANFHPENFARMRLSPSLWGNPLARIVNELSLLYQSPARRTLTATTKQQTDGSQPTAEDVPQPAAAPPSSPLDAVLALVDLDSYLELVEKMTRFQDAVWVRWVVSYEQTEMVETEGGAYVERGDSSAAKLRLVLYDPSCADVVEDPEDPTKALAWYYHAAELGADGVTSPVIHYWTPTEYFKLGGDWKTLAGPVPNPYGRIPATVFRRQLPTPGSYYVNGSGRDLFEATLEACMLKSIQNARFRDGAFKQVAIVGGEDSDDGTLSDQVMGGPTPIFIPSGGSATVLDLQPALQQMSDMCSQRQLELAASYGISVASYRGEAQPQSGFAKKLDLEKVLRENRRIRKQFAESERDLYHQLATVLGVHPIDGLPVLDPSATLTVDFAEPSFADAPETQVATDARRLELGLTSILEILARENPDLAEEELMAMAEKHRAVNAALVTGEEDALWRMLAEGGKSGGGVGGGGGSGFAPTAKPDAASSKKSPPPGEK